MQEVDDYLKALQEGVQAALSGPLRQMEWAEDEISKARLRHGEREERGPIWSSFRLLRPTCDSMALEAVYRAHCRELLDRVAGGQDTRPATDVEIIHALREACLAAPLTHAASALYLRLFARALGDLWPTMGSDVEVGAYETLHGDRADEHETWLRAKLSDEDRV